MSLLPVTRVLTGVLGSTFLAGSAAFSWGFAQTRRFALRRRSLVLSSPPHSDASTSSGSTSPSLRILHISDLHLLKHQKVKKKWVASLGELKPDLIVLTGDLMAGASAFDAVQEVLAPFLGIPGVYVCGSNDYYAPVLKNPFTYLARPTHISDDEARSRTQLPWDDMDAFFRENGWVNLNNSRAQLTVRGWRIDFVGVDDPHMDADVYPPRDEVDSAADIRIGLTHAPYRRVLDAMAEDECDIVFAGHTHGGQVCVPGVGALVTNCDLTRQYASGLFQWPPTGELPLYGDASVRSDYLGSITGLSTPEQKGAEDFMEAERYRVSRPEFLPQSDAHHTWVNVSAGLGTSPFAPVRIACPPEAIQFDILRA